jgi:hypothetical protein
MAMKPATPSGTEPMMTAEEKKKVSKALKDERGPSATVTQIDDAPDEQGIIKGTVVEFEEHELPPEKSPKR